MTEEEVKAFIEAHEWTYAKSYPKAPHFYVVREKCRSDDEFVEFVKHIRRTGYPHRFWRKMYIYLDVDGWSYWTMGNPLAETTIINRAKVK